MYNFTYKIAFSKYVFFPSSLTRKMGKRKAAPNTRAKAAKKAFATPSNLDETEPPIARQIIGFFYFLRNSHPEYSITKTNTLIAEAVIGIWKKVNSALPIQDLKKVSIKVARLTTQAQKANRNSLSKCESKY